MIRQPHQHGALIDNPLRAPHVVARIREFVAADPRPGKPGNPAIAAMVWSEFRIPCNFNQIAGTLYREHIHRGGARHLLVSVWTEDRKAQLRELVERGGREWSEIAAILGVTANAAESQSRHKMHLRKPSEPHKPGRRHREPRHTLPSLAAPPRPKPLVPRTTLEAPHRPSPLDFRAALPRPMPQAPAWLSGRVIECQWLDGHAPDWRPCPERSAPGRVWCTEHLHRAVVRVREWREAAE